MTLVPKVPKEMERSPSLSFDDNLEDIFASSANVVATSHLADDHDLTLTGIDSIAGVKGEDYGQKVLESIEAEYKGMPDVASERAAEKVKLEAKLKNLQKSLKKVKNVKNHKMKAANAKNHELRVKIKDEIESIKDRLYDISLEEKGAGVTSSSLVDATINSGLES